MLPAPPVPPIDPNLLAALMPALVGHDKRPSAFVVYLALWRRMPSETNATVRLSHQALTNVTGLSRSAVQAGLDHLRRRGLIQTARTTPTSVPAHTVLRPWVRRVGRAR